VNSSSTPQLASALYRFCPLLSHFAYIDRRTCLGISLAGYFPLKIAAPLVGMWTYMFPNTCFLRLTGVHIPDGISVGSATFAQLMLESTYASQWASPFPLKIAPFHGETGPPHGCLGPPESLHPKQYLDQFSRFCRAHDRDRLRDRPRYSVCNNRPHLHILRCGLKMNKHNNKTWNLFMSNCSESGSET